MPTRTHGAALFADISGFTPLTEALAQSLGPQRGSEELTRILDLVYDALIIKIHNFGGAVISFSGDAITCWFDGDNATRATTCALAMQTAMKQFIAIELPDGEFAHLAMKVAVALGSVRRFVVGDPDILLLDVMAGVTLDHLAAAEHHALKGEVILDHAAARALGRHAHIVEWRAAANDGARFAVVRGLTRPAHPCPWPPLPAGGLTEDQARPWVFPPIFERLRSGQGEFVAELRPAVTLFLRFIGINYDDDPAAGQKLDAYIRWVEGILARYDGYLMQITIGDKGSYLYAVFGAPVAHGDDPRRAAAAALDLRAIPPELSFIQPVQIGITRGRMRAGPYGGVARHTYGVIGDTINLSARLMQHAEPGQILVTDAIAEAVDDWFLLDRLSPITVKGKSEPVAVCALAGPRPQQRGLQEVSYTLPMVGRQEELALIDGRLAEATAGHGQIVGITAEAGMGKSRLLAEVIRQAAGRGFVEYGGAAQSFGTNNSYLAWTPIWQAFFGLDAAAPVDEQIQTVTERLTALDPSLLPRLPLLGIVLNLPIPDNDLTRSLDAKLRKTSLEALLVDCVRARVRGADMPSAPHLLILEDTHWLDPLSADLVDALGRAIADLPVVVVLSYRPPEIDRLQAPSLSLLPHYTEVVLKDFSPEEARRLILLKLEQLTGVEAAVPPAFVEQLTTRAQGNPFYIEELINYLNDRGIEPGDVGALATLDLPTSLHSLILSRIDQLTESQKITIKVASVIGRLFRVRWLWGAYPGLGAETQVKADLATLHRLDLTPEDQPEPEQVYIFKHIVTEEVAYASLLTAMRTQFHGNLAQFIERAYPDQIDQQLDLLAFHYAHSSNDDKKREYLLRAGDAAHAAYANDAALDYYRRLLPLVNGADCVEVILKLGQVLELVGRWDEVDALYRRGLAEAEALGDRRAEARCQSAIGWLLRKRNQNAEAAQWLAEAQVVFEQLGDQAGLGQTLHFAGAVATQQGDRDRARELWQQSLQIRRDIGEKAVVATLLNNLGIVAHLEGNYDEALEFYDESLALATELGDRLSMARALNNRGMIYRDTSDFTAARTQLEASLALRREVGDRWGVANGLNNLGQVARELGDYASARRFFTESLTINRELGDRGAIAYLLEDFASLAAVENQPQRALRLAAAAETLRETLGAPLSEPEQKRLTQALAPVRESLGEARAADTWASGRQLTFEQAIEIALTAA
ncbi:MAG: tetratricopeptide repeat protein [Anaerolineae bacterium]